MIECYLLIIILIGPYDINAKCPFTIFECKGTEKFGHVQIFMVQK